MCNSISLLQLRQCVVQWVSHLRFIYERSGRRAEGDGTWWNGQDMGNKLGSGLGWGAVYFGVAVLHCDTTHRKR